MIQKKREGRIDHPLANGPAQKWYVFASQPVLLGIQRDGRLSIDYILLLCDHAAGAASIHCITWDRMFAAINSIVAQLTQSAPIVPTLLFLFNFFDTRPCLLVMRLVHFILYSILLLLNYSTSTFLCAPDNTFGKDSSHDSCHHHDASL